MFVTFRFERNLISRATLDASVCKYTTEGGVKKVNKGALIVMKAQILCSLYVLEGSIIAGAAFISTLMPESDVTKL